MGRTSRRRLEGWLALVKGFERRACLGISCEDRLPHYEEGSLQSTTTIVLALRIMSNAADEPIFMTVILIRNRSFREVYEW